MAKRKLKAFSADDAGDNFTPTVKILKASEIIEPVAPVKKKVEADPPKAVAKEPVKTAPAAVPAKLKEESKPAKPPASPAPPPPVQEKKIEKPKAPPQKKRKERTKSDDNSVDTQVQLVGFRVGAEEFGVDIQEVQEINRTIEITPVPRTPEYVEGVVNLRGKVIPVINMRIRFGLDDAEATGNTRIVIVEVSNKIIGMLVDSVSEVLRISARVIEPPPDIVSNVESEYIKAVAKLDSRLVILLDLNKMMLNLDLTQQGDLNSNVAQ